MSCKKAKLLKELIKVRSWLILFIFQILECFKQIFNNNLANIPNQASSVNKRGPVDWRR